MDRREFLKTIAPAAALAASARPLRLRAAETSARMTMVAGGDCLIARRVSGLRNPGFRRLLDVMRQADCRWGNCEVVLADASKSSPVAKGEDPVGISEPWAADELKWAGFNLMGTANNHTLDYSAEGMFETLANLDRVGIVHAGSGADLAQASRPAYLDTDAGRVGLVSCALTFPDIFAAGPASGLVRGRPGLNPLHVDRSV